MKCPNPYDSPRASTATNSGDGTHHGTSYDRVLHRARHSQLRTVRLLIYGLFIGDLSVVPMAAVCWVFATDWDRETGAPALLGLIGGVIASCITACATFVTIRFMSSLNWFERSCGFATIPVLFAGLAIAYYLSATRLPLCLLGT